MFEIHILSKKHYLLLVQTQESECFYFTEHTCSYVNIFSYYFRGQLQTIENIFIKTIRNYNTPTKERIFYRPKDNDVTEEALTGHKLKNDFSFSKRKLVFSSIYHRFFAFQRENTEIFSSSLLRSP